MRHDRAHLRTRVNADGMDYKGYNIAVHELGHNIEEVFSVTTIDHTLLQGVPNNAFTEALAFLFQQQDMALLGMPATAADREAMAVLEEFWNAREIAGVSLVDIGAEGVQTVQARFELIHDLGARRERVELSRQRVH